MLTNTLDPIGSLPIQDKHHMALRIDEIPKIAPAKKPELLYVWHGV